MVQGELIEVKGGLEFFFTDGHGLLQILIDRELIFNPNRTSGEQRMAVLSVNPSAQAHLSALLASLLEVEELAFGGDVAAIQEPMGRNVFVDLKHHLILESFELGEQIGL